MSDRYEYYEDIDNLYEKLEKAFPEEWEKGLDGLEVKVIDDVETLSDVIPEEDLITYYLKTITISYKGNIVSISVPYGDGGEIKPKTYFYWEDLEKFGKILEVVAKVIQEIGIDFEPEEKYNELVGDEYDSPEEFKVMLEQDKEELLEKAKEIKLELDKL